MPGATDYFYVASEGGNYNVVATDASNGCEVEAVIFDVVAECSVSNWKWTICNIPNPVDDKFTILNLDA